MEDLVSVIIPVYNAEKYLVRCVDSVINQTYKNLEIILVDDGSPDNCGKICDKYAEIDQRIRVVHKKNSGSSGARNKGIENSRGEYLSFVDSDDFVDREYIKRLYELLKESDADISACSFITTLKRNFNFDISEENVFSYSNLEALEEMHNRISVMPWGKLYKRHIFGGIYFPLGKAHEDEFVMYKLFYKAKKIIFTTRPMVYWRRRDDSVTGGGLIIEDYLEALLEEAEFFRKIGLNKLSDNICKLAFASCFFGTKRKGKFKNSPGLKEHKDNLKKLRKYLRKSNQRIKCKIFYEIYFIIPSVVDFARKIAKNGYFKVIKKDMVNEKRMYYGGVDERFD